eukprot:XP_016658397.1 PREDICTED: putative uncharacterized protein DDB_G0282133 [Acyrthosiphon pisum]
MYTSNNVRNESFEYKTPKKKIYDGSSTELNTYTEEKMCEKYIEQNITDSYSRKNVSQKEKSEKNTLADISLGNNCSMDNENVLTKKPKKKRNHNKSLNLIHINTNNDAHFRTYEKVNEHNINDLDSTKNISQKRMSEMNALLDISLGNDFNNVNENVTNHRTYEKDNKHIIDDPEYTENITKIKMSEINDLTTMKPKKKKKHNKSLNTTTEAAIKSFDRTFVEVNEQNIINSYSRKNVSRKRKSEINALADISLGNSCSIDNENVPTKKTKRKKNCDEFNENSIEFNTNHDTKIQIIERNYESELNTSSEISSENKCSMDYDNVAIKKPKKKKNHDKSLNSIELNTNNDAVNDSDSTKNISLKRMSQINALPTKSPKKKKNRSKNLNLIEFNTNHDTEIQIFERTYDEINDSYYGKNVKPDLNTLSDILSENELSMDNNNVSTKKPKKKKNKKRMSEMNALPDISLGNDFNNDDENVPTKKPKKMRNHNKSLNLIHSNTNHDSEIFERMCEEVSEPNLNNSDTKVLASASLEINDSLDNEHLATKESEKRKKHDKITNNLSLPMISQSQISNK